MISPIRKQGDVDVNVHVYVRDVRKEEGEKSYRARDERLHTDRGSIYKKGQISELYVHVCIC